MLIPSIIILILIALNGIFVAAEFSIVAASKARLTRIADGGSKTANKILGIISDPRTQNQYIATSQVGITIASLGLGMYGEHTLAEWLIHALPKNLFSEESIHIAATFIAVSLMTYLHVVLGEMIPKSIALQSPESTPISLNPIMTIMEKVFKPIVIILNIMGEFVTNLLGIPAPDAEDRLLNSNDLEYLIEESFENGLIEDSDQLFIENILDLEGRAAKDAMTPRNKLISISNSASLETVNSTICGTSKTRYPVYNKNIDEIIGILHLKDFARFIVRADQEKVIQLDELIRPVTYVPEAISLDNLLIQFRKNNTQLAVVLDEYGGTAGIITIEDLVEEVVGEILDEFDDEAEPISVLTKGKILVQGNTLIEEINQHYNFNWQHEEANTIAGLVMVLLGEIPSEGYVTDFEGIKLEIGKVEKHTIQEVIIYLPGQNVQTD
ncbi:MAG: hemolysin family protein [Chloroflexota bacterium]